MQKLKKKFERCISFFVFRAEIVIFVLFSHKIKLCFSSDCCQVLDMTALFR